MFSFCLGQPRKLSTIRVLSSSTEGKDFPRKPISRSPRSTLLTKLNNIYSNRLHHLFSVFSLHRSSVLYFPCLLSASATGNYPGKFIFHVDCYEFVYINTYFRFALIGQILTAQTTANRWGYWGRNSNS